MFYLLAELLPARLQSRAKALIAGALSTVVTVVAAGLLLGTWDKAALVGAIVGLVVGPVTERVPNLHP